MAIVDKNINNWFNVDRDQDVFIGLSLPIQFDEYGHPTKTTLEAIKMNLLNLCSTEEGERVMQPNLGVRLKRFLFEQFNAVLVSQIQNVVTESINYWMPFLVIRNIDVWMDDDISGDYKHKMNIKVEFFINKDPSTHESVEITVGDEG